MKFISGCIKSPYDQRDFLMRSFLKEYEGLPAEYDLTDKMTPVESQGKRGSCTGFAGTACKEYFDQIDYNRFLNLSPEYLYSEAQIISGHVGREGSTLRAVMKVLLNKGVCEEKFWPYEVPQNPDKSPMADKNASKYKIKAYAKVLNLTELKRSLVKFGPSLAGIYVYKSIYKTKSDGIVPNPNRTWPSNWKPLGGHAIAICSYSDSTELVKFKNSWGPWGFRGFGFLSYKYIRNHMVDCYSMVDILDDKPYIETINSLSISELKDSWI